MSKVQRPLEPLNDRELEILKLLEEGLSNREIANRLHLAYQTVKGYNSDIYGKLDVTNRDDAVKLAHKLGLLASESEKPTNNGKHNLPESVTEFVGRETEIADVLALLETDRLVTILAPGGMGKTRLSLEVARTQIGKYRDGVYFVPLAPLGSPNDIVTTIAENIGFVFHGDQSPAQQLVNFLKHRAMLLVLDNFEHLMEGANLVSDIIKSTSDIHLLITSRERLNLRGEVVYSLRGLTFPTWETSADALEYDAVKLFLGGARRARPDFEVIADDLNYLAIICKLTEGMPLGIELAAGWVDVLSLEKIADEIQQGIDILETELRDIPERHRSLRATFEHTWNRLTDDERSVFMKLSVFRGGFTLESAEAVAGANIRHLRKLTQKSLIQIETDERYAIHELLRQFGESNLAETDELPTIQAKHAQYFADFMAERRQDIKTNRDLEAVEHIALEYENLRRAWLYVIGHNEWYQLSKFLHGFWFFWDMGGARTREEIHMLENALNIIESVTQTHETEIASGQLFVLLSSAYTRNGNADKGANFGDRAIKILRKHQRHEDLVWALYLRQHSAQYLNQQQVALSTSLEGVKIARSIGDRYWEGHCLAWHAWSHRMFNNYDAVQEFSKQALNIFQELNNRWGSGMACGVLGAGYEGQERYDLAYDYRMQAINFQKPFQHPTMLGIHHLGLGRLYLKKQDDKSAIRHLEQALQIYWSAGYIWYTPAVLIYFARIFVNRHNPERAVEILSTIDNRLFATHGSRAYADSLIDLLKSKLEPERYTSAWQQGTDCDLNDLVKELLTELET